MGKGQKETIMLNQRVAEPGSTQHARQTAADSFASSSVCSRHLDAMYAVHCKVLMGMVLLSILHSMQQDAVFHLMVPTLP